MASRVNLVLNQNNDMKLAGTVLNKVHPRTAKDLTGCTVHMYIKPTKQTADNDGSVVHLTSNTSAIVITDATAGKYEVTISAAQLALAGLKWYRVDAVQGSQTKTSVCGSFSVRDL